eukprot:SAG11_NODE_9186_length_934_cov_1.966467_1_plen_150_part_10
MPNLLALLASSGQVGALQSQLKAARETLEAGTVPSPPSADLGMTGSACSKDTVAVALHERGEAARTEAQEEDVVQSEERTPSEVREANTRDTEARVWRSRRLSNKSASGSLLQEHATPRHQTLPKMLKQALAAGVDPAEIASSLDAVDPA